MSDHAERLRELFEIKTDMALVMGPGTYRDLWRSDAAALLAGAEALDRMEAIQAERDAALAEVADRRTQAARAQEALRHLMNGVPTDDAVWAAYGNVDSARAWLAQQRAEAAEAERRANTDVIRLLGPAFCDFFFGGPGEAEYLAGLLRQQRREAAAEVVNALADGCERAKRPILAQELRGHVAALLAGAEALERLEAMESASLTMLPKSASVSEVGND